MIKVKVIVFVPLLLIGLCQLLNAQDFKKDMIDLSKKMAAYKDLSFTLHYSMFLDNDFSAPYQQRTVNVIKSSVSNLYCKDDNSSEYIINKSMQLLVNHKFKQIVLKPQAPRAASDDEFLNVLTEKFDTLMMVYQKVSYKKMSDELIQYECIMKAGVYKKMLILYNTKNQLAEKITYFHKFPIKKGVTDQKEHPLVIEIAYRDFNFKPKVNSGTFSEKKYVQKNGTKYSLLTAYSSYKFINLFENNL